MSDEKFILDATARNQLICGDALKLLPRIPTKSVDALVTDPPFAFAGGISNGRRSEASDQFFLHWWKDVCKELHRILKDDAEGFIWCDWHSAMAIASGFVLNQEYSLRLAQMLYHYREMPGNGSPFRNSVDMIAYIRGWKSDGHRISNKTHNLISKYWYYGKHQHHPSEKDVEIAKKLLEWCSDKGDIVIDPFMGSGTVPLACLQTGRNFIGIDIDENFVQTAKCRLKEESMPKITVFSKEEKSNDEEFIEAEKAKTQARITQNFMMMHPEKLLKHLKKRQKP